MAREHWQGMRPPYRLPVTARLTQRSSEPGVPGRDPSGRPLTRPPLIRPEWGARGRGAPASISLHSTGLSRQSLAREGRGLELMRTPSAKGTAPS
jgi:hypothetical protein